MSADLLLLIFLLTPIFHAMAIGAAARVPALRDAANIIFACGYAWLAFTLVDWHQSGSIAYVALARPLPTADFAFAPEPIGLTAAATFAALGALNAPFAGGFFRAMQDKAPARAEVLIALSVGLGCAASLAANLFTFLLCYQAMIVASFPLVAHNGGPEIRRAGQIYFGILLTASIALLLPAMAWTHGLAGRLDFIAGVYWPARSATSKRTCCSRSLHSALPPRGLFRCIRGCRPQCARPRRRRASCIPSSSFPSVRWD
ncbi:MAG: hypothetical protein WDN76_10030 [Alphaproteobacteria bacterium]